MSPLDIEPMVKKIFDLENPVRGQSRYTRLVTGLGVTKGHRNRHGTISRLWLPSTDGTGSPGQQFGPGTGRVTGHAL